MDICFLTCICLWQISQIQTFLFKVVGPGLVSTSSAFVSNSASHPAGPHAHKNGKSVPHCWGRGGSTQFAQQLESTVTAPSLVGCVVWSLNKEISTLISTNKTEIWREHIEKPGDHRRNTSTYWNTIHGLAHNRPPQQDNNPITFKDNTHINPKDIASAFNKQFINTIPHKTNTTNRKITRKVLSLQPTQINITTEQVLAAIKNSKNKNSTKPDNIDIKHLKNIGKNELQYLTNIYNAAINDKIPHVWKLANIIPIPKPNKDINIGTSYRPISLLSVIAKTLEKVILPYITQNIPNITTQHGFKTKHSTNTALQQLSQ